MAIYRPPKPRWPAALVAGIVGLLAGLLLGTLLSSDPEPAEAVRAVRADLASAASLLEVASVEYEESVSGGEVVSEQEFEGAKDAIARSRELAESAVPALRVLAPSAADAVIEGYDQVEALMAQPAEPSDVNAALDDLRARLIEGS